MMISVERIYYYYHQSSKSSLPMTNMSNKRAKTTTSCSCSIEKVDFSSNSEHDDNDRTITAMMQMIVLNHYQQLALWRLQQCFWDVVVVGQRELASLTCSLLWHKYHRLTFIEVTCTILAMPKPRHLFVRYYSYVDL